LDDKAAGCFPSSYPIRRTDLSFYHDHLSDSHGHTWPVEPQSGFMDDVCTACGGRTEFDSHAVSAICTDCGTLVDSSQAVLTHDVSYAANVELFERSLPVNPTLKSFRSGSKNWDLAGQGKETRDRRNLVSALLPALYSYV
jgi:predicted RNA-binding Zn-ribbon protein involved in translation (DUF1610 family)